LDESTNKKWTDRDSFFGKKFPFGDVKPLENFDLSSIKAYVQNVLSNVPHSDAILSPEIFETLHVVIVQIKLPKKLNPKNLQVLINAHNIKIKGQSEEEGQLIKLPCSVIPAASKAHYKQGILEIKMPKVRYKEHFHEVFIQF
jgi:HSP20 family molecular chaperone IbpA